ncbi:MAG: Uma2 family endonuclease [Gemmataceae bacterium]
MPALLNAPSAACLPASLPTVDDCVLDSTTEEKKYRVREAPGATHLLTEIPEPLTVAQYHELIRAGILTEDDPVELLEGRLVPKMPKNPPHRLATGLMREALEQAVPKKSWYVDSQEPITLTDTDSEPEPDVMVVRGARRDYTNRHPGPDDLALVVEVSDATLAEDRTDKRRSYARASISIYWILNLRERQLEVYSQPTGPPGQPTYNQRDIFNSDQEVPVVIDGNEVARLAVRDFLP